MNEKLKNGNKIAIIILGVCLAVSIGFNIYFGRRGSVEYANQLRDTIADLRTEHDEQGEHLVSVRAELELATREAGELRDGNRRAVEITLRSDDRLTAFETTVDGTTDIIERIERRQQRIDELAIEQRADNRELREALGERNAGSY